MNYTCISYPIKPGKKGLFNIETDIKLIEGNIIQILGTRKGERVMLPLFGSRILDFIHEPLDHITCALLRHEIIDAVSSWEKRITLRYYLITHNQNQSLILEINRKEGVSKWLD